MLKKIKQFTQNGGAVFGGIILIAILIIAITAPLISPHEPNDTSPLDRLKPPSVKFLFGTDHLGRDIFSRVLFGSRISITIGILSAVLSTIIGGFLGMIAGYWAGVWDSIIGRIVDILLAFPAVLLALLVVSILGTGIVNVIIAVGFSGIPQFARLARGEVLSVKEETYVESANASGASTLRILFRHIIPNIFPPILTFSTLKAATSIITAASLSFLGLGAQPPLAEWGSMLSKGRNYFSIAWWFMFFPGFALLLVTLSLNLVGDGLRDIADPKRKI